ncbi:hypothetical protein Pelo_7961 [Pelomyxa schiedti]|nr:hypothetical protein Pelo_7961 [Pelomyxa schiedti]
MMASGVPTSTPSVVSSTSSSVSTGKNAMVLVATLKQALLYATTAVAADEKLDYLTAHQNYMQAVDILSKELARSPDISCLLPKMQAYQRRMELIEQTNPILVKHPEPPPESAAFEPIAFVKPPPEIPCEDLVKPFHMMKTLLTTMTTGGFLTPKLYIPSTVWNQRDVKLTAVQAKLAACYPVIESLQRLQLLSPEPNDMVFQELTTFSASCDVIQNTLSQHLGCISGKTKADPPGQPAVSATQTWERLQKGMKTMIIKGAAVLVSATPREIQDYVFALKCIFKESQFLVAWISNPALHSVEHIRVISDFMRDVVCTMAVKDLGIMLEKYTQRAFAQISSR